MACVSPVTVVVNGEETPVPCRSCYNCRKRRINEWAFRAMQEDKHAAYSHFVTLTYDTDYVPITNHGFMSLDKKHLTDFLKRLRYYQQKYVKSHYSHLDIDVPQIRYFAAGEYGAKTERPHYHLIIFNVLADSIFSDAWTFGHVDVGTVSAGSITYTMKYLDKPGKIPKHQRDDRVPEFQRQSLGFGKQYLKNENIDWHRKSLDRNYVTMPDGWKAPLPEYYRRRIWNGDELEQQRTIIDQAVQDAFFDEKEKVQKLYGDRMTYEDYQKSKQGESFRKSQTSFLTRNKI